MSLAEITDGLRQRVGEDCGIGSVIKLDFGADGQIRIDGTARPNVIDNTDGPADCTIRMSMADFLALAAGDLNPQMAFMLGKLKIEGDMGLAMKLGGLLG